MKRILLIIYFSLILSVLVNCQKVHIGDIDILTFDQLESLLHHTNDTLYLFNFWATWCIPCREEIPVLLQAENKFSHEKFKLMLVSLDFQKQIDSQLKPFLIAQKVHSSVILLNAPDPNSWINKVDSNWTGTLPFSLVFRGNYRQSFYQAFNHHTIDSLININLKTL